MRQIQSQSQFLMENQFLQCLLVFCLLCGILISLNVTSPAENLNIQIPTKRTIPKVIVSTYHSKEKIPSKVYENMKKYAPNYQYIIFDDDDIVKFLEKYYGPNILRTFHDLQGPHKADLFRYCYLYKFGGIYLDIKTELMENMDDVFHYNNIHLYTAISHSNVTLHQGVLASVPENSIFLSLINYMVKIRKPVKSYMAFTVDFYNKLKKIYKVNTLKNGKYTTKNGFHSYLFYEKTTRNPADCKDGMDRYNYCAYIYDDQNKIIKTRYSDYPW